MDRAAWLYHQGGLHEALAQHQVDLEGRAQGVAGVSHAGDFSAGLAQEGVVLAKEDPLGATGPVSQGLDKKGLESGLCLPVSLGEEAVVGAPILLGLAQPFQGAGEGFGLLAAEEAQGQSDELVPGSWVSQGPPTDPVSNRRSLLPPAGDSTPRRCRLTAAVSNYKFFGLTGGQFLPSPP